MEQETKEAIERLYENPIIGSKRCSVRLQSSRHDLAISTRIKFSEVSRREINCRLDPVYSGWSFSDLSGRSELRGDN
jgi:hypothetical protein